jgi:phage baseplate assembly protein gpV
MPGSFMEWVSGIEGSNSQGFSIAPGTVKDNFNLLSEGKVQVHIPSMPEIDPWARVASVGAGSGRGFLWIPQIDDEVLVAFNRNDNLDAYVIGGLWSMMNRPPTSNPIDFISKRIIKTGVKDSPLGHTIEIDDLTQSIKITTSTSQEITMDPEKISIQTTGGLLKITLDMANVPPGVSIESTGDISLSAPLGKISLDALSVEIFSELSTDISSTGTVGVTGDLITLN